MANLIDSLSKKSLVTATSVKTEKEGVKEAPSLFDSLLKDSSQSVDSNVENKSTTNSVNKEEIKVENKKEDIKTDVVLEEKDIESTEEKTNIKSEEKVENKTNQGSLLDRLVIEAKKGSEKQILQVEVPKEVEQEEVIVKVDTTIPEEIKVENKKEDIKTDVVIEEKDVESTEEKTNIKSEEKVENKTNQGSLLDRLLIEAKKDSEKQILQVEVLKEVEQEEVIVKVDTTIPEDIKTDVVIEEKDVESTEEKTNIKSEEKVENKTNQGSLLDRLLIEAKKDSEKQILQVEVPKEVEQEEVIVKVDTTIPEEIKVESKKEDIKNVSALLDKSSENISSETIEEFIVDDSKKDFASLEDNVMDSAPISLIEEIDEVKKEDLFSNIDNKPKEKQSLMDLLILKNSQKVIQSENEELIKNQSSSSEFISNMYLSSQKNILSNQLLFNKKEAMTLLQEGQTLKDVEKSADLLDLGLENVDVEQTLGSGKKLDIKEQDLELLNRKSILDKLFIEKNIKGNDLKGLITQSIEASKALIDDTLNIQDDVAINVNSPLSYNIQSRIIGAKQQMSMMMSDIARQMYENYKPPVTVFKINLNPLELGSIAILMKNDRNNGLNISMNVSNITTLDALVENQSVLKNSLNKTFNENTAFNLDFNSSNQGDNQSQNSQSSQEQKFGKEQVDTQTVLQLKEENKDREDSLDYM